MPKWTKETALKEIDRLINEIDPLHEVRFRSAAHAQWFIRTEIFLKEVFGENSQYTIDIANTKWGNIGSYILIGDEVFSPEQAIERRRQQSYRYQLDSSKGLLQAAADQLIKTDSLEILYNGKNTSPEASTIIKVINLAERKLRKVIRTKPDNERLVQDAFQNLLIGADVECSREANSIEYSSKTYIPDFIIPKSDLAI